MTEPSQPHDKLFKGLLDQPGAAGALIRERLPPEISCLLTDDPPELVDGEFIDEALQVRFKRRSPWMRVSSGS